MSGGSVPYHLRQNKAVERGVFVDLLFRVGRATPDALQRYQYVGLAGPFSEDFKLLHAQIGIKSFVSIESKQAVLLRQRWNSPLRGIDYQWCSTQNFIDAFVRVKPTVVWLDYAAPSEVAAQLAEVEQLIAKLQNYDILKVTFCASDHSLERGPSRDTPESKIEQARQRLGDYLPAGTHLSVEDVDWKGYPKLVMKCAELAVKNGMRGSVASRFQLLTTFSYSDSAHRMLTFTGIVLPRGKVTEFFEKSRIAHWDLATTKWGANGAVPKQIQIPELSLRERLFVDQQLPKRGTPKTIMRRLGFRIADGGDAKTVDALASYRDFYRYFPYFSKMVV